MGHFTKMSQRKKRASTLGEQGTLTRSKKVICGKQIFKLTGQQRTCFP